MGKLLWYRLFLLVVLATVAGAAPAPAAAPAGRTLLPPDFVNATVTLVVFLVLLAVLCRFAWGPILAAIHLREAEQFQTIADAAKAKANAEALRAEAEAELARAKEAARALVDEGRAAAKKIESDMLKETEQEIAAKWARAECEIAAKKEAMTRDVRDHAVELGVQMAATVIRQRVSGEAQGRLVNESLAALKGF